ncbi:MAG: hypothetical protein QGG05_10230 [Candidatus Latescibacteria bacterium]|nr:hypothetical protein [Candidatus Latescibacterota bacterium]
MDSLACRPSFEIFPVADLLTRVQSLLQPQFDESDVEFHTHVDPPTLEITADGEQVEQVLLNLLRNVRQAATGKPGARVNLNS